MKPDKLPALSGPVGIGTARLVGIDITKIPEIKDSKPADKLPALSEKDFSRHQVKIKMPYISGLSINHMRYANYSKILPVKQWMTDLENSVNIGLIEQGFRWTPKKDISVSVRIDGIFRDKRSCPDLHNLSKVLDPIAKAIGINDRLIKFETGIPTIKERDYGVFFYGKYYCLEAKGELTIKIEIMKVLE